MGSRLTGLILLLVLMVGSIAPLRAENPTPYSGTRVIGTGKPFLPFVEALKTSITDNNFVIVGLACANCAIKAKFGEEIPGNRVFLIFRPDFARRMLAASTAAGIEAPIRIYVTEATEGTATVTYRLPSHVFGAYDVPALTELGGELDVLVDKVLADAAGS
jgi:uncharacterized protein (DUF302 family)